MTKSELTKKAIKKIKDRVKAKPKRGPVTVYLDSELYRGFRDECEKLGVSASLMFEELMREFLTH